MEVIGKIKIINETQTLGNNGFKKRELVLTTDEQYPQTLLIEFTQDKCDLLNNFQADQDVKISINLRGREWISPEKKTIYFNSIQGWRIESLQEVIAPTENPDEFETVVPDLTDSKSEDDLPF